MKFVHALALASITLSGVAHAQQPPTPEAPAALTPKQERSAKSLECSKKAEEKNLHGKPRKHFMNRCKRS